MAIESPQLGNDVLWEDDDLVLSPTGDVSTTMNGRTTLLQDVENGLNLIPGELFGHSETGAGLRRIPGQDDQNSIVIRAIDDFLRYDSMVCYRIDAESITIERLSDEEAEYEGKYLVSFIPIGEDESSRMNLVWGY